MTNIRYGLKLGDSLRIFWPALRASLAQLHQNMYIHLGNHFVTVKKACPELLMSFWRTCFFANATCCGIDSVGEKPWFAVFLQFCFLFEGCLWLILVVIRLCGEEAMVWCRTAGGCSDVRHKSPECSTKVGDGFHRQTLSMMNIHPRKRKVNTDWRICHNKHPF